MPDPFSSIRIDVSEPSGSWKTNGTTFVDIPGLTSRKLDLLQGDFVEVSLIPDSLQSESYIGISGKNGGVAGDFQLVAATDTGPALTFGSQRVRLDHTSGWNLHLPPSSVSFALKIDAAMQGIRFRMRAQQNAPHGHAVVHHVKMLVKVHRS